MVAWSTAETWSDFPILSYGRDTPAFFVQSNCEICPAKMSARRRERYCDRSLSRREMPLTRSQRSQTRSTDEMGCETRGFYDVGVAGLHRLFKPLTKLLRWDADVILVIAGREGALPTVVAGLVDVPVIAVPTSRSYGFGDRGIAALAAMLQSCSLGLAVVNIDSGVGAGSIGALIANRAAKGRRGRTGA